MTRERLFSVLKEVMPYLHDNFGVSRIAVFGSFAQGTPKENSDIDLLIEFSRLPGLKFIALADYLEKKLGKEVDILTPGGLQGIRLPQVSKTIKKNLRYV